MFLLRTLSLAVAAVALAALPLAAAEPITVAGEVTAVDFQAKTFTAKTEDGPLTLTVVRSTVGLQLVRPGAPLEITYNPDDKVVSEVKAGSSPMAWLREQGFTSSGTSIYLKEETEFRSKVLLSKKMFDDLSSMLRQSLKSEKEVEAAEKKVRDLVAEHASAAAQLANIQPGDVVGNNRLVGRLRAIEGQVELERAKVEAMQEKHKSALSAISDKQREYTDLIRELRPIAETLTKKYAEIEADEKIKAAVASLSALDEKEYKVGPSRTFVQGVKSLDDLEKRIESQSIPLVAQSNTFLVEVLLNGKHKVEMVFDTGASLISLPSDVATRIGLKPSDDDQTIVLTIADGRQFNAKLMTLDKVRVGQFEVEHVECAVLPPELADAPVLLGGSFLKHFNYTLDPAGSKVTMVRVQTEDKPAR